MKRLLISIFISLAILILWASVFFALENFQIISEETSNYSALPFRLPAYIYEDIFGFEVPISESEDIISPQEVLLILYSILFNVVMYGVIIHFIIGVLKKLRLEPQDHRIETPPEPPIFD